MRSLVVLGGAVIVAGASIAGLLQIDKSEPQVAGFRAVMEASEPARKEYGVAGQAELKSRASVFDVEKRLLIAALGGKKHPTSSAPNSVRETSPASTEKQLDIAQKADRKLVDAIKKKAVTVPEKWWPQPRKNIAYKNGKRTQSVSARSDAGFAPTLAIRKEAEKTANPSPKLALLTKKERNSLAKLVEEKKLSAIDMVVEFDYKSAKLSDKALPVLARIGAALTDGQLADATFVIAGHTDAVGGNSYNMDLSSQRASSVRNYLKEHHKIDDRRLVAVGYGEERLKNRQDPNASENRRVEFINLIR